MQMRVAPLVIIVLLTFATACFAVNFVTSVSGLGIATVAPTPNNWLSQHTPIPTYTGTPIDSNQTTSGPGSGGGGGGPG